ncbi:KTSC domain-containing protein [Flavobacterium muglaense]|uniref:KTSC domain-containing protein n=1 Tax=Flavobacterium muglaense TaxID=2764716 RepID=A0A923N4E4_9FLAO|nr:KTSC domain-containing protein [Flavobacterium muglaense]MBC5838935.1 KTSC domain-containing protein [Flavobacterium muglaense]MBC5845438.1 KTSC domain-containing protein [Flavobacterium muglaense]
MKRYPVKSCNIKSVGYDEIKKTLEIEFKLLAIHHYFDVTIDEFVLLMKAPNIESHYLDYVYSKYYFDVS